MNYTNKRDLPEGGFFIYRVDSDHAVFKLFDDAVEKIARECGEFMLVVRLSREIGEPIMSL